MITTHVLVKNEENFIWYSIMSIINYVDSVKIWDTGSTDKTLDIISQLTKKYPGKIFFKEVGNVNEKKYSILRQDMLNETKTDWLFILDGDEIWWENSIEKVIKEIAIKGDKLESIIVPTINLIGDIFHFQEVKGGQYKFGKRKGHYALRFINKNIPGLHVYEDYGKEGFADADNTPIQNRDEKMIAFIDAPYLHATHLERSSKDSDVMQRSGKIKHELGIKFTKDFYYPESFFIEKPHIVPNIWKNMNFNFKLRAFFETPLKKIKRRI